MVFKFTGLVASNLSWHAWRRGSAGQSRIRSLTDCRLLNARASSPSEIQPWRLGSMKSPPIAFHYPPTSSPMPVLRMIIAHSDRVRTLWERYIHRIETRNAAAFRKWGALALILFVAIPLPMTGVFTGAVASTIFQVPLKRALPLLLIGSIIASVLVAMITVMFQVGAQTVVS